MVSMIVLSRRLRHNALLRPFGNVVTVGRNREICQAHVRGFSGAQFKSFGTRAEAQNYLDPNRGAGRSSSAIARTTPSVSKTISKHLPTKTQKPPASDPLPGGGQNAAVAGHFPEDEPEAAIEEPFTEEDEKPTVGDARPKGKHPYTIVFTDGSAFGNCRRSKSSAAGIGVYFGKDDPRNASLPLPGKVQTNQRAEVYAAIVALQNAGPNVPLAIESDSQYLIKGMTEWIIRWRKNGFKNYHRLPVENADLFRQLDALVKSCLTKPLFIYVKAHCGIEGNEAADDLAKEGARKTQNAR